MLNRDMSDVHDPERSILKRGTHNMITLTQYLQLTGSYKEFHNLEFDLLGQQGQMFVNILQHHN